MCSLRTSRIFWYKNMDEKMGRFVAENYQGSGQFYQT